MKNHVDDESSETGSNMSLRPASEHLEVQAEELKAWNKILQAANNELRSSAEKLETVRLELQSVNEELISVNRELKIKIGELSQSNNDFRNLINSTDVGTIFLDRTLRVNHFSPRAGDIFYLLKTDIGRPLSDVQSRLEYSELSADAENVLHSLQMVERDVRSNDGKTYLMRMTPYRTSEDRINGVVLALFDITKRVAAEEEVRQSHARISDILESINDAFCAVDLDGNFTYVNKRAQELWGMSINVLAGRNIWDVCPKAEQPELYENMRKADESDRVQKFQAYFPKVQIWNDISVYPSTSGISIYFRDISEQKRRENNLAFLAEINNDLAAE